MNKTLKIVLAVTVISFLVCGLVFMGINIGRSGWTLQDGLFGYNQMPMKSGFHHGSWTSPDNYHGHMMSEHGHMMSGHGHMMGGHEHMDGYGMMEENCIYSDKSIQPLTIDEADQIIHEYLENIANDDLVLGEIMIFDNHAYAQIIEKSTGIGAMEILIDPLSKSVSLENGPNMMWNLKYSPMGSAQMHHGSGMMSGGYIARQDDLSLVLDGVENMPVSSDKAIAAAQKYLDKHQPGTQADEHADLFYGYYTIHVLQNGDVKGMLSVNGLSGQVLFHNWHGDFIQMSDH